MKKFVAMILCVAMLASMAVVANAKVIELPDGGSNRNTGCSQAYGYTDGGTAGKAYMNCTIEITNAFKGTVVSWTTSNVVMGTNIYMSAVAWQDANHTYKLEKNEGRGDVTTTYTFSRSVSGGSATVCGTGGHQYSSAAYGDWLCGTATN